MHNKNLLALLFFTFFSISINANPDPLCTSIFNLCKNYLSLDKPLTALRLFNFNQTTQKIFTAHQHRNVSFPLKAALSQALTIAGNLYYEFSCINFQYEKLKELEPLVFYEKVNYSAWFPLVSHYFKINQTYDPIYSLFENLYTMIFTILQNSNCLSPMYSFFLNRKVYWNTWHLQSKQLQWAITPLNPISKEAEPEPFTPKNHTIS